MQRNKSLYEGRAKPTYRYRARHSSNHNANGGLRGEESRAAAVDPGRGTVCPPDVGFAWEWGLQLLLLLLFLDLALELLFGIDGG